MLSQGTYLKGRPPDKGIVDLSRIWELVNNLQPVVKCDLFKAFCCNMYCSHLWCDFKNETLRRLIVGYNHSFRIIMKYPRHCSASGMFVFNNVPSFKELWRKSIYGFKQRVDNSLNKVVNTVANTTLLSSRLRKHWRTVLYRLPAA